MARVNSSTLVRVLWAALFIGLWQAACTLKLVSPILLASPTDIIKAGFTSRWEFLIALKTTSLDILAGVLLAWSGGIAVGAVIGLSPRLSAIVAPLLSGVFAVPRIVLFPIMLGWFGLGSASKIAFGAFGGFFPIAIATMEGVRQVDQRFVQLGRSIGASSLQMKFQIVLPLAIPNIVSGLRIGTGLVVIGVLVGEMIASLGGIGYLISYHRTLFDTGHVYFGIVLALAVAGFLNYLLSRVERRYAYTGTSD